MTSSTDDFARERHAPLSSLGDATPDQLVSDRVIEVTTASQYSVAKDLLMAVFTDPTDLEPEDELDRFFESPEIARYLLFVRGGREIGSGLVRINPRVPSAMYVPYTGILKGHSFSNMKRVFVDLMIQCPCLL